MMPHKDWLSALVRTQQALKVTAVTGPVQPNFASPPPRWLADVFGLCYVRPMLGRPLISVNAGNLLLDRGAMAASGLSLDF
jgi:hypothetical protein